MTEPRSLGPHHRTPADPVEPLDRITPYARTRIDADPHPH
ncbi:hypothetical protein SMA5143A_6193 [Streptomyces sp. MA5143a]|nr:hypothetical protein SMA5143A_6193 [Streptomyces sp. MA5143a]